MRNYNNYKVWIKSHELVQFIYKDIIPVLPIGERFELTKQLKLPAYSVPFNIVEGAEGTQKKILRISWTYHLDQYWK